MQGTLGRLHDVVRRQQGTGKSERALICDLIKASTRLRFWWRTERAGRSQGTAGRGRDAHAGPVLNVVAREGGCVACAHGSCRVKGYRPCAKLWYTTAAAAPTRRWVQGFSGVAFLSVPFMRLLMCNRVPPPLCTLHASGAMHGMHIYMAEALDLWL